MVDITPSFLLFSQRLFQGWPVLPPCLVTGDGGHCAFLPSDLPRTRLARLSGSKSSSLSAGTLTCPLQALDDGWAASVYVPELSTHSQRAGGERGKAGSTTGRRSRMASHSQALGCALRTSPSLDKSPTFFHSSLQAPTSLVPTAIPSVVASLQDGPMILSLVSMPLSGSSHKDFS